MKFVKLLLLSISVCFFLAGTCEEDDDSKVLKPRLTLENMSLCYDVRCIVKDGDTTCYKGFDLNPLPKEHACCLDLIPEEPNTIPDNPPPDTLPPSRLISVIIPDSLKVYGFDDGREYHPYDKYNRENRVHYLSVKENGSSLFKLYVSPTLFRNFTTFVAKIENRSILSFDSSWVLDTFVIQDTLTEIKIYGRLAWPLDPIRVSVKGMNRTGEPKTLVCDTCEEDLKVLCYREKVFDSLRIYVINNPSFNIHDTIIRNGFNTVLKQSVLCIQSVGKYQYNRTGWDNNNNSILDLFPIKDSVPPARLEHERLRDSLEITFSSCKSCSTKQINDQPPKIFILPSTVNQNWLLMDSAKSGGDTIVVQYSAELTNADLFRSIDFTLCSWGGSNAEVFKINSVIEELPSKNRLKLRLYNYNLRNGHPRHSVLVLKDKVKGFTLTSTSCAWVCSSIGIRNMIHEYLHMANVGPLNHAPMDSSNIMYPTTSKQDTRLRYRLLKDDYNSFVRQWQILITNN